MSDGYFSQFEKDFWPKKTAPSGYAWPKLGTPGPWSGGSYPALATPKAGPGGSYPDLKSPGPWEGSDYGKETYWPKKSGPSSYKWKELEPQKKWPGMQLPSMRTDDHWGEFPFRVEIEGLSVGAFTKVDGLNINVEQIEYAHGDDLTPKKRAGRIKVDNVKLSKGYINTADLYNWCDEAMKGDPKRKSVSVILLSDDHATELCRYNLFDCWPCKWSGFRLDAKGNGALVEEIEFVVESMKRG